MRNFLKFKQSQVGTTLTWFTAVFIIFFILLLYVAGAGALAGRAVIQKIIPFGSEGFNSIELSESSEKVFVQDKLIGFLNSPVEFEGREMRMKDLISRNVLVGTYVSEMISSEADEASKIFSQESKNLIGILGKSFFGTIEISVTGKDFKKINYNIPSHNSNNPGGFVGSGTTSSKGKILQQHEVYIKPEKKIILTIWEN